MKTNKKQEWKSSGIPVKPERKAFEYALQLVKKDFAFAKKALK